MKEENRQRKIKQGLACVMAIIMIAALGGCATVKKKFTRKKKQTVIRPQVYTEKEFVKPYSNHYYYASHFKLWKVWHEDLLKSLDGNEKRRNRAAQEVMGHLVQMKVYLIEPKADEFQAEIDRIAWVVKELKGGKRSANTSRIRTTLEKSLRVVRSKYETRDMKEFIKPDEIEL